jgi:hypothetical protein
MPPQAGRNPMLPNFRILEFDGLLAPLLLLGALPSARWIGGLVEHFDWCERAYGELFGGLTAVSFSIGFAISGLRQTNPLGKVGAILTLLIFLLLLLTPTVTA